MGTGLSRSISSAVNAHNRCARPESKSKRTPVLEQAGKSQRDGGKKKERNNKRTGEVTGITPCFGGVGDNGSSSNRDSIYRGNDNVVDDDEGAYGGFLSANVLNGDAMGLHSGRKQQPEKHAALESAGRIGKKKLVGTKKVHNVSLSSSAPETTEEEKEAPSLAGQKQMQARKKADKEVLVSSVDDCLISNTGQAPRLSASDEKNGGKMVLDGGSGSGSGGHGRGGGADSLGESQKRTVWRKSSQSEPAVSDSSVRRRSQEVCRKTENPKDDLVLNGAHKSASTLLWGEAGGLIDGSYDGLQASEWRNGEEDKIKAEQQQQQVQQRQPSPQPPPQPPPTPTTTTTQPPPPSPQQQQQQQQAQKQSQNDAEHEDHRAIQVQNSLPSPCSAPSSVMSGGRRSGASKILMEMSTVRALTDRARAVVSEASEAGSRSTSTRVSSNSRASSRNSHASSRSCSNSNGAEVLRRNVARLESQLRKTVGRKMVLNEQQNARPASQTSACSTVTESHQHMTPSVGQKPPAKYKLRTDMDTLDDRNGVGNSNTKDGGGNTTDTMQFPMPLGLPGHRGKTSSGWCVLDDELLTSFPPSSDKGDGDGDGVSPGSHEGGTCSEQSDVYDGIFSSGFPHYGASNDLSPSQISSRSGYVTGKRGPRSPHAALRKLNDKKGMGRDIGRGNIPSNSISSNGGGADESISMLSSLLGRAARGDDAVEIKHSNNSLVDLHGSGICGSPYGEGPPGRPYSYFAGLTSPRDSRSSSHEPEHSGRNAELLITHQVRLSDFGSQKLKSHRQRQRTGERQRMSTIHFESLDHNLLKSTVGSTIPSSPCSEFRPLTCQQDRFAALLEKQRAALARNDE